ncbi:MAG: methionyl-tRNA formyltransferase [Polyangia bacterium]|jgi:methionyl-tRNA formyltransferase|nr:methionyl-tRNA formyltransferase [Polyangia bacterium]
MQDDRRYRVLFMGSPEFAVPLFEAMVRTENVVAAVTQPDRPAGRGRQVRPPAVKVRALELGIPVLQPARVRTPAFRDELACLCADLFVVAAYGRILTRDVLAVPPLGCWNLHASLLPTWRGAAPIQWSLIAGDAETGVTVMRMDEGMDTGDIALQRRTAIAESDTASTLSARLARIGADAMMEALSLMREGLLVTRPQDERLATHAPPLRKEDGLIDFREPAQRVVCRARGVDPWPGAHALLHDERVPSGAEGAQVVVRLFGPRADSSISGSPGVVLDVCEDGLVVGCGQGAVVFAEVQLPGKKRLPAKAVLAGRGIKLGDHLGTNPRDAPR